MNLSKALAAIIISASIASPAFAATKTEGWYAIENGKETPLHLTMKLPAGSDNTKNIYACYYTPDAGKPVKDRWTGCGLKRDPRMPKEDEDSSAPPEVTRVVTPVPVVVSDPCSGLSGSYYIAKDRHMLCPLYVNSGQCNGNLCVWVNANEQYRNAYYYPAPQPYYYPGYYGQTYYGTNCCYSNYNSKPMSKTGKALMVGGAAALVAGLVIQ